ncbi:MAG: helix-turn-helix domain-containing protein [bacterium]
MKGKGISESMMAKAFEQCLRAPASFPGFPNFDTVVREVMCQQGVADFIAAVGLRQRRKQVAKLGDMAESTGINSIRVLSLLKPVAPRTKDYLVEQSGLSRQIVTRVLAHLVSQRLAKRVGDRAFRLFSESFSYPGELWAFELKLNNWKRALFQASQYKAFASRVVTVFPMEREKTLKSNLDKFDKAKVGVMIFDASDRSFKVLQRPSKIRPSSRMHYLFAFSQVVARKGGKA